MEILAQRTPTTFLVRTKGKLGRIFRFKDSRFQEIKMGSERLMASFLHEVIGVITSVQQKTRRKF